MRMRSSAGTFALVIVLSLAGGCGGGTTDTGDRSVISIGIGEPKFLVPSSTTETEGAQVLHALFTPLVEYDAGFRPVEVAAESISTSDNRVWTITLKPDWTFHNGERVTADSYINAWNAGAWGPNAHDGNYFFDKIAGYPDLNPTDAKVAPTARKLSGLVKKDDLTFEVTLRDPYVNFKSMLGYTAFFPLPSVAFEDVATNTISPKYQEAPIGQGPFMMQGVWQHDQVIETVRYEAYKGPRTPVIDGVTYKIYQSQPTQYQDLLAGQLDIVKRLPIEAMASARSDLGDRFAQTPSSAIQILAFPTFDRHYRDVRIRRAISMAIDREEITRTIFLDTQTPLRSFVSPVVPGYRENTCGAACEFNPSAARALFESAGGRAAVGGRIQITYNNDGGHKPWIDATCNQLKRNLGVDCVGNPEAKFADMLTKAERKEPLGAFRMGWVFDYPAMENYLGPLYTTRGSSNYYGYSNPEFDRLVAQGDRAATPEEATRFYQQAEDLLARDLPVLPLRYLPNTYGFSTRVRNVRLDPFEHPDLYVIEVIPTP
jgi:peptide/nickel transport system substrate-binding protein/oligopeptide transport system substrate-binding protein